MPNSTDEDDRPIGHLPQKPTCRIMTSESKAGGQMGCAMTNCKLHNAFSHRNRMVQSPQQSQMEHTRNRITDVTFTSLQCTLHESSVVLQMRRVHDEQAQQWRASMISWSCRDVQIQCALQKLRRQCSLVITAVRVPPSREKGRRSTTSLSSDTE